MIVMCDAEIVYGNVDCDGKCENCHWRSEERSADDTEERPD